MKFVRKRCGSRKVIFCPSKKDRLRLLQFPIMWNVVCYHSLMILVKKDQKRGKSVILRKFSSKSKTFILKVMKAISYKMKQLIKFIYLSKKAHETCNYSEYVLHLQKERQIWTEIKNKLLLFCEKSVSKAVSYNELSKNLRLKFSKHLKSS